MKDIEKMEWEIRILGQKIKILRWEIVKNICGIIFYLAAAAVLIVVMVEVCQIVNYRSYKVIDRETVSIVERKAK